MYFFFMILDRLLSVAFGHNFQPYGSYVPPGFTVWGHLFNGSLAVFDVWAWLKLLGRAGRSKRPWPWRAVVTAVLMVPAFLIPYGNDAEYLTKLGFGGAIPLYVMANAAYVVLAGIVSLKLARSKWGAALLLALLAAFLLFHFIVYAPMFPEFQWT
jgi:hypothetical protein